MTIETPPLINIIRFVYSEMTFSSRLTLLKRALILLEAKSTKWRVLPPPTHIRASSESLLTEFFEQVISLYHRLWRSQWRCYWTLVVEGQWSTNYFSGADDSGKEDFGDLDIFEKENLLEIKDRFKTVESRKTWNQIPTYVIGFEQQVLHPQFKIFVLTSKFQTLGRRQCHWNVTTLSENDLAKPLGVQKAHLHVRHWSQYGLRPTFSSFYIWNLVLVVVSMWRLTLWLALVSDIMLVFSILSSSSAQLSSTLRTILLERE